MNPWYHLENNPGATVIAPGLTQTEVRSDGFQNDSEIQREGRRSLEGLDDDLARFHLGDRDNGEREGRAKRGARTSLLHGGGRALEGRRGF